MTTNTKARIHNTNQTKPQAKAKTKTEIPKYKSHPCINDRPGQLNNQPPAEKNRTRPLVPVPTDPSKNAGTENTTRPPHPHSLTSQTTRIGRGSGGGVAPSRPGADACSATPPGSANTLQVTRRTVSRPYPPMYSTVTDAGYRDRQATRPGTPTSTPPGTGTPGQVSAAVPVPVPAEYGYTPRVPAVPAAGPGTPGVSGPVLGGVPGVLAGVPAGVAPGTVLAGVRGGR